MFNTPFLQIDIYNYYNIAKKLSLIDKIDIKSEDIQNITAMSNVLQKSGSRALISIEGPIAYNASPIEKLIFGATSTVDIMSAVQDVAMDDKIKSVVFIVNSGGGEATKMHVLADMVHALSQKKATATLNTGLMASAAYYAGSQTGKVFLDDRMNQTGSIGTCVMLRDTTGMAEKAGIKVIPVSTGPLKGLPADGVEITEEVVEYAQDRVNELQQGFNSAVNRVRPNADMEDGSEARSGKTFSYDKSKELGLVDGIKSLDEVFAMLEAGNKYSRLKRS